MWKMVVEMSTVFSFVEIPKEMECIIGKRDAGRRRDAEGTEGTEDSGFWMMDDAEQSRRGLRMDAHQRESIPTPFLYPR